MCLYVHTEHIYIHNCSQNTYLGKNREKIISNKMNIAHPIYIYISNIKYSLPKLQNLNPVKDTCTIY